MRSVALVGVLALSACSTLPVTTDSNPNASVSSCRSYQFAEEHVATPGQPAGAYANPLNSDRLRAAIAANLQSRGILPAAEHRAADCIVGYAIGSRVVADPYASLGVGFGYGGWGRRGFGGFGYDWPYVRDEGRITVDLFDARTHQAIWHAAVNQNVTELTGPNAELKINAAAAAIFGKFPVMAPAPAGAPAAAPTTS